MKQLGDFKLYSFDEIKDEIIGKPGTPERDSYEMEFKKIDPSSMHLLEKMPYDPRYNEQYLLGLIKRASRKWTDIADADDWISEIRETS